MSRQRAVSRPRDRMAMHGGACMCHDMACRRARWRARACQPLAAYLTATTRTRRCTPPPGEGHRVAVWLRAGSCKGCIHIRSWQLFGLPRPRALLVPPCKRAAAHCLYWSL